MKKKAFTLLEVMISITMLTFTAVSVYQISKISKVLISSSEDRATAMYLAQEWVEFARNLRDSRIWQSTNRENWRDKFLLEDIWFSNLENSWKIASKIIDKKWLFSLKKINPKFFRRKISSIDQICTEFYNDCFFEVIKTRTEWQKEINWWEWVIFFRKISFEKIAWEKNLITIKSSVYWDYKWEIQNFSLETKLWNITIF